MYETLEHWNQYKKEEELKELKLKEWKKEMDKFLNKLIVKNGTTKY